MSASLVTAIAGVLTAAGTLLTILAHLRGHKRNGPPG